MSRDMDLAHLDATETAALIGAGDVSAIEVVDAAIERVEALDPVVNALVVKQLDQARAQPPPPTVYPRGRTEGCRSRGRTSASASPASPTTRDRAS